MIQVSFTDGNKQYLVDPNQINISNSHISYNESTNGDTHMNEEVAFKEAISTKVV